jgi:hypothetical protein
MRRIKFKKGKQRDFLTEVLKKLDCPSLRALNQFGFGVPYSTLKNYFNESRTLPESLFNDLCYLSKIDVNKNYFESINEHWGQVKGGQRKGLNT